MSVGNDLAGGGTYGYITGSAAHPGDKGLNVGMTEILRVAGTVGILLFLLSVAWTDAHTARIPDRLLLAGVPAVLLLAEVMARSSGIQEPLHLQQRLLGMAGVSGLLLCLSLLRPGSFGGGDVKLTALTGFLLGWKQSWYAFAVGVFSAGIYVLWKLLRKEAARESQIPFGPFLCLGAAAVLLFHDFLSSGGKLFVNNCIYWGWYFIENILSFPGKIMDI